MSLMSLIFMFLCHGFPAPAPVSDLDRPSWLTVVGLAGSHPLCRQLTRSIAVPAEPNPSPPHRLPRGAFSRTKAIYERGLVKRGRCRFCGQDFPHIPLAVGVGRSGPISDLSADDSGVHPAHIL